MTNKKFNIPIEIPIIANTESIETDSTHVVIYAKSDGKLYTKKEGELETPISDKKYWDGIEW
jgi:hypothetical protein